MKWGNRSKPSRPCVRPWSARIAASASGQPLSPASRRVGSGSGRCSRQAIPLRGEQAGSALVKTDAARHVYVEPGPTCSYSPHDSGRRLDITYPHLYIPTPMPASLEPGRRRALAALTMRQACMRLSGLFAPLPGHRLASEAAPDTASGRCAVSRRWSAGDWRAEGTLASAWGGSRGIYSSSATWIPGRRA
jgi:hypothetical protein